MQEEWKDITKFEGCYQVSNLGNIKRLDTEIPFKGAVSIRKGRLMKLTRNSKGYLTIVLCWKSKRKTYSVHRLVANSFIPLIAGKDQVNHIDGNTENNCVDNLEWCTPRENQLHALNLGLKNHGEKATISKLTEKEVLLIKQLLAKPREIKNTKLYKLIAKDFNVTYHTIKWIDKGRTWFRLKLHNGQEVAKLDEQLGKNLS